MNKYTIEITEEGQKITMTRKNEGFDILKLIGFITVIKDDLLKQYSEITENNVIITTNQDVQKDFDCPQCRRANLMKNGPELLSDPPQYRYTCPICGFNTFK